MQVVTGWMIPAYVLATTATGCLVTMVTLLYFGIIYRKLRVFINGGAGFVLLLTNSSELSNAMYLLYMLVS